MNFAIIAQQLVSGMGSSLMIFVLTLLFSMPLGLLVAFCLLFAVLITVTETLLYRVDGYFAKEYQKYAVTERVDMRLSDLLSVTDEMMDYLKGDRENLNVEAVIGGVQREFFNAKEKRHMQDVRELFIHRQVSWCTPVTLR